MSLAQITMHVMFIGVKYVELDMIMIKMICGLVGEERWSSGGLGWTGNPEHSRLWHIEH